MIDYDKLAALEGLLFLVGDDGLTTTQLVDLLDVSKDEARDLISELRRDYEDSRRGIRIDFLGNSFKLTTKKEHRCYYEKLLIDERCNKLSNSAIETLAIIAYNEPITRIKVDEIRGVQTGQLIRKLVAKGLVKECGRADSPSRPILYKTTSEFLDYFGLSDISELPKINVKEAISDEVDLYESKYKDEI